VVTDSLVHDIESRIHCGDIHAHGGERLALVFAVLLPPVLVLVFVAMMSLEADNTLFSRVEYFATGS